jgi:rhodanese-related sulfurtransferase
LKVVYAPDDGRILGAQGVGGEGVDKRIDVIATSMYFGGTVHDLARLDLAYAPPFGSAKDPIHMVAFAACNDLANAPTIAMPDADLHDKQVIDVRTAKERQELPLAGAIAIGVDEMIDRWQELDPKRDTVVVCHSGKRAHVAACWLQSKGFASVRNLTGGMAIRSLMVDE